MDKKVHKYKVVLSGRVKKQMNSLPESQVRNLKRAMRALAANPYLGSRMNLVKLDSLSSEKCACGKRWGIYLDANSNEVYFNCAEGSCPSFWMTLAELTGGRNRGPVSFQRKSAFKK